MQSIAPVLRALSLRGRRLVHSDDIHAMNIAMNRKSLSAGIIALLMIALESPFAGAQNGAAPAPPKTTDQAFKNIQILKGIPADQLLPSMQFITASLGVECQYCHVEGAFEKDDKKPKQTARKMMEMMFAINKGNFEDHRAVTCYTCHRGNAHPVAIPIILAGTDATNSSEPAKVSANDKHGEDQGTNLAAMVDPILEKYISALGGVSEALRKGNSLDDMITQILARFRKSGIIGRDLLGAYQPEPASG